MRKLWLAAAAVAAVVATPALAADMAAPPPVYKAMPPPAPIWSWTGFYLGANVGGAWANHSAFAMTDPLGSFPFNPIGFSTNSPTSVIGGIHGGYNYQIGPTWLVGIETDFSWTSLKLRGNVSPMTNTAPALIPNSNAFDNTTVRDIGSVRARVGVLATPDWLLYVTGGYAYGRINYQGGWTCGPPGCAGGNYLSLANFTKWQSGWVAGAGAEYHVGGGWIVGGEYLYYGLNDGASSVAVLSSVPAGAAAGGCTSAAPFPCNPVSFGRFGIQELRARLSYKF